MKLSKHLFTFCLLLNFTINGYSQKHKELSYKEYLSILYPIIKNRQMSTNCENINTNECNLIRNNNFNAPSYNPNLITDFINPFGLNLVTNWLSSHGSPQIFDELHYINDIPPFPATSYTLMNVLNDDSQGLIGEGIVQKLPNLIRGEKYGLSFFKKRFSISEGIDNFPVDNFSIYLIKCEDYNNFNNSSNKMPIVPVNHQEIYCEKLVNNLENWEQIWITFTCSSDYDMIWFSPYQNESIETLNTGSNLLVAYPELIKIENFSAGSNPIAISPNCVVNIGPNTPNCSVVNAKFEWVSPNGNIIEANNDQRLSVDASLAENVGTWTLQMTVPNIANTTNTCSQSSITKSTVEVTSCLINCTPIISPSGPIDYYRNWEWVSTDYANYNYYLTSSSIVENQWYIDNIPVSGYASGTSQKIDPNKALSSLGLSDQNVHFFTVQSNGCISTPVQFKYTFHPISTQFPLYQLPLPLNNPASVCENTTGFIHMFDLGPNASYKWNIGKNYLIYPNGISPITFINGGETNYTNRKIKINTNTNTNINPHVFNIAELNGRQIVYDYGLEITNYQRSLNYWCYLINVYAFTDDFNTFLNPGGTNYQWEEYEMPANSIALNYSNNIINTNPLTFRFPGGLEQIEPLKVKLSGSSSYIKKTFYTSSNNNGECYTSIINYLNSYGGCKPIRNNNKPQIEISKIEIYPNPTSKEVTIISEFSAIKTIEIFDMYGNCKRKIESNLNKKILLNVSDLNNGIYNLKILIDGKSFTRKLVINKS